jgi:zinc/manganese transport system permease protein
MGTLPVSPYITTLSFLIYLVCRVVDGRVGAGPSRRDKRPLPADSETAR